ASVLPVRRGAGGIGGHGRVRGGELLPRRSAHARANGGLPVQGARPALGQLMLLSSFARAPRWIQRGGSNVSPSEGRLLMSKPRRWMLGLGLWVAAEVFARAQGSAPPALAAPTTSSAPRKVLAGAVDPRAFGTEEDTITVL